MADHRDPWDANNHLVVPTAASFAATAAAAPAPAPPPPPPPPPAAAAAAAGFFPHPPPGFAGAAPSRSRPKKATKHRKRHIPVGPAGVLFQQALQRPGGKRQRGDAGASPTKNRNEDENQNGDDDDDGCSSSGDEYSNATASHCNHRSPRSVTSTAYTSPAWTAAQCGLQLSTPSCPFHWTCQQKYAALRPHLPSEYLLVPEILNGAADWHMKNHQKLLVQVVTVQAVTGSNDHLWTVSLSDETGFTLRAWLRPAWVRQEQQQQHALQKIRVGCLWLLRKCTVQFIMPNNDNSFSSSEGIGDQQQHDRILLVAPDNVEQVWNSSTNVSNAEYIQWMEARNALTANLISNSCGHSQVEPSSQLESDNERVADNCQVEKSRNELASDASATRNTSHQPHAPSMQRSAVQQLRPEQMQQQQQQHLCAAAPPNPPFPPLLAQAALQQNIRQQPPTVRDNSQTAMASHPQQSNMPKHLSPAHRSVAMEQPGGLPQQPSQPPPTGAPPMAPSLTPPPTSILRQPRSAAPLSSGLAKSVNFETFQAGETQANFLAASQQYTPPSFGSSNKQIQGEESITRKPSAQKGPPGDSMQKQIDDEHRTPRGSAAKKKKKYRGTTPGNSSSKKKKSTQASQLFMSANAAAMLDMLPTDDEDEESDALEQVKPLSKEAAPTSGTSVDHGDGQKAAATLCSLFQASAFADEDMEDPFDDDDIS